ncbi:MAG: tetratricopeptide repeat protein [Paracoccaceae bacterium]
MFIRLVGVFQVLDDAGLDCTPRGAKTRAILAVLCQTPDRRRPRRWLESKLWSDRGPEQASGSLRQALMELRKALGPAADLVVADRDSVRLGEVGTDLETDPAAAQEALLSGRDFLEGIDIVDPAFLDWLREERARVAGALGLAGPDSAPAPAGLSASPAAPPFVISFGSLPDGAGRFAAQDLAQAVARLASEFAEVEVFGSGGAPLPDDLPAAGLELHLEGAAIRSEFHMMASLVLRNTGQTVWSQRIAVSGPEDVAERRGDVPAMVFQAAEAALMQMPRLAENPLCTPLCRVNALIARAVTEMFSYDAERLRAADALLAEASAIEPLGRIDAWRSLVRQIMFVERTEGPPARLEDESDAFARRALEQANGNPLVLALVSQTRVMVDENPEAGTVLARDAVRLSPFNAFGYWSEAGADIRHGRHDEALAAARMGTEIASRTSIGHWWEALAGLAALRGGHVSAAIAHYEAAYYRAPNFRAAMRHLVYLYLEAGAAEKAARVLKALLRAEPDFSAAAVLREDYPAITLRRSGLAERHEAALAALAKAVAAD